MNIYELCVSYTLPLFTISLFISYRHSPPPHPSLKIRYSVHLETHFSSDSSSLSSTFLPPVTPTSPNPPWFIFQLSLNCHRFHSMISLFKNRTQVRRDQNNPKSPERWFQIQIHIRGVFQFWWLNTFPWRPVFYLYPLFLCIYTSFRSEL